MPVSKAQQKAVSKYMKENYDVYQIRMPKGKKAVIQAHAKALGESVNGFIGRAIDEAIARDTGKPLPLEAPTPEPLRADPGADTDPEPVAVQAKLGLCAFTEDDARQVDLKMLARDFRYQFEIQDQYGKAVLSDLLEKARENDGAGE
ncbi:MAG: hypothetical protein LIO81_02290 [Clostridiales bacterium]|nr:hypothetical protein [Clostridiales bacterium]